MRSRSHSTMRHSSRTASRTSTTSFEPNEHLATLVLRHVVEVRDRLALECVSRVWRAAGRIPGVWQSQELTLTGDIAARLTNARFCRAGAYSRPLLSSTT